MTHLFFPSRWWAFTSVISFGLMLAACTAPDAAPPKGLEAPGEPHVLRLLVKLTRATADPAQVSRQVSDAAGVPVQYRAAASTAWHAVTLNCPTEARCTQALQRLRQSPTIQDVEVDRPVVVPSSPPSL
ncbi:MAG: hypothetical protein V4739_17010 [Pseudomonadota bacterium]